MSLFVNFTFQNLLSAGDSQSHHFLTQMFTCTINFLLDFCICSRFNPICLCAGIVFCFIDYFVCTFLCLRNNVRSLTFCFF